MHFIAPSGDVSAAAQFVAAVIGPKPIAPVLSAVLIEAGGGRVVMRCTDLDADLCAGFDATTIEPGMAAIDSRIAGLAGGFPPNSDVSIATTDTTAAVKSGRSTYRPQILPAGDFPAALSLKLDQPKDSKMPCSFALSAADALALFDRPSFAISTETTRYYLTGLHIHCTARHLISVGTDGARLARMTLPLPTLDGTLPAAGIIVPRTTIARTVKLLKAREEAARIRVSETRIEVAVGDRKITSKLVDAAFPDYERVLPKTIVATADLDVDETAAALERLDAITDRKEESNVASFAWGEGDGAVAMMLPRAIKGAAEDTIDAKTTGDAAFAFSISKMLASLKHVNGDIVQLKVSEHHGPIVTIDPADENFYALVMPVRV